MATFQDPILLLRDYIMNNKKIDFVGGKLYFGNLEVPLSHPTAWKPKTTKQYTIGSLWFYLQNSDKDYKTYIKDCGKMGVDLVSRPDMPEIISYFKGESDTSEAIDEELRASTLIKKTSREEVKEERRAAARETLERPLCTKESILQTPNVSYKYLLAYCNESVKNRKRQRESSSLSFLDEVLKLPHKSQDIPPNPIILVPSNPSPGNLCLYNSLQFLDKGIYVEDIQDYAIMQPVMFTRKIRDKFVNFEIYDQTLTFNKNHWRRVAAVFVQGPRYQFKDWPLGNDLVQLFLSVRGFYMKYHDVPADENVKKWNVKQLLINRNKRHMDRTIQNEFWAEFEKFLFSPRYNKSR